MPFLNILIHAVWATKGRKPLMNKANKDPLCNHIRNYALEKNIHIINVNGHLEHLHCFISMSADQNIATLTNLLKGGSPYWANKNLKWAGKTWKAE